MEQVDRLRARDHGVGCSPGSGLVTGSCSVQRTCLPLV